MKFTKEGLEEGWFYMSLENEYKKCGLIVSYHGNDMIQDLLVAVNDIVSGKKRSEYFCWTQEPEYQMMYLEKKSEDDLQISVYDFSNEQKKNRGDVLPKGFHFDEKVTFRINEKAMTHLASQVLNELGYYRQEGKEEYNENWVHLDKGTKIPFPEKEWKNLEQTLQKNTKTV